MRHTLLLPLLLLAPFLVNGQSVTPIRHLTIFDANVAEFMDERTLDLQPGLNTVEVRGLMPQAAIRSLRVTATGATVVRQNITYDGPEVRNQKTAVVHLVLKNSGAAGPHKVRVDYLAPGLSWKADYSLVLAQPAGGAPPEEMLFDGWIGVQNDTNADVAAATADLVVGEVHLLSGDARATNSFQTNSQSMLRPVAMEPPAAASASELAGVSVFARLRLGRDIAMTANIPLNRFPLFQGLKLAVEQRNIFENDARTETLGRGGFMLQPQGLETRLVARNTSTSPLPAGTVTIYSQDGEIAQVAGQDRIPLTPVGADFSVTQGRSNTVQGTRRILERREEPDPLPGNPSHRKLITRVEIVIFNRGAHAVTAYARDGVEEWANRDWTVVQSTHPSQKLGDHLLEFKLTAPAGGSVKLEYTVECR